MADNFAAGKLANPNRPESDRTYLSFTYRRKNGIRSPSKNFVRAQRSHAALLYQYYSDIYELMECDTSVSAFRLFMN